MLRSGDNLLLACCGALRLGSPEPDWTSSHIERLGEGGGTMTGRGGRTVGREGRAGDTL